MQFVLVTSVCLFGCGWPSNNCDLESATECVLFYLLLDTKMLDHFLFLKRCKCNNSHILGQVHTVPEFAADLVPLSVNLLIVHVYDGFQKKCCCFDSVIGVVYSDVSLAMLCADTV